MKKFIKGKFKNTGINKIDIDVIIEKWNNLWGISQYGGIFKLYKGIRKDSEELGFKTEISAIQANDLIDRLGLSSVKSGIFKKAATWKKYEK